MPLRRPTAAGWLEVALGDFDAVLADHAHCEKKAAASAMALVSSYPENTDLVRRCIKLAQEELRHFTQVHQLIIERGGQLSRDRGDPYARELMTLVRSDWEGRRTDRLLVCSLIEARSAERLGLLSEGLTEPHLKSFYSSLATAEAGHYRLFVDLAERYADPVEVAQRLTVLAEAESEIVERMPLLPRIH